ncbi:hypothetical protein ACHAPU_007159 [Fusarium lateritium]
MAVSTTGDVISIPVYTEDIQNKSKGNADVLMYIEERFYKETGSHDYIGKIPGARQDGNTWVVTIDDQFRYGEKNKSGECRWLVLHDRSYKMYQHRFLVTTVQSRLGEATKNLARSFGADDIANQLNSSGSRFVDDYLHAFEG